MKKLKFIIVIGVLFMLIALGFILYPAISNFINDINNESKAEVYTEKVGDLSSDEIGEYLAEAKEYNDNLVSVKTNTSSNISANTNINTMINNSNYNEILNINNGMMGTVKIPKINVMLPIYHGIDDDTLENGAGHMPESSFPVGGLSTHAVISAHTAYPGKEFFNNLTELEVGDVFYINILGEDLKYKVFDVSITDPEDTSKLKIVDSKDYVSLLTCYPYAVNTHRLVVTGERVEIEKNEIVPVTDTLVKTNTVIYIIIPIIFVLLFIGVLIFLLKRSKTYKRKGTSDEANISEDAYESDSEEAFKEVNDTNEGSISEEVKDTEENKNS